MLLLIYVVVLIICIIATKNYTKGVIYTIGIRLLLPASVRIVGLDISINSFLTIFLAILFVIKGIYRRKMDKQLFNIFILFFLSTLILSPFASDLDLLLQLKGFVSFFITDYLLAIMSWYAIKDMKDYSLFLKVISISIILICSYGIYEYIIGNNPINDWAINEFGAEKNTSEFFLQEKRGILNGRIMGMTFHPLALGLQMGLLYCFFINNREYFHSKSLYAILITLIIINAFLSGSRTSLIMIILAFILYIFFCFKKNIKKLLLFIVIFYGISILAPKSEDTKLFIDTIESSLFFWDQGKSDEIGIGGSSVSMRMTQLNLSFSLIKDQILAGYGYGFSYIALGISKFDNMKGFESIIFKKIIEQGILGLTFFLIYYCALLKHSLSFKSKKNETIIYFLIYFIGIAFTDYQNTFYLFLLLALIDMKHKYICKREL